jgi:hypothetical protein
MKRRHVTFAESGDIELKDELAAMEEDYSSIEIGLPSNTELNEAIFQVQRTLLNHRPMYLQISKQEFASLLLKALGPTKLSSTVVNHLFDDVDNDNDGWLSVEELAMYMIRIERRKSIDMYTFFSDQLVCASILGSFAFLCASALSISKNLFIRVYDGEHVFITVTAHLVVWVSLIGSFLFVWGAFHSGLQQLRNAQCHLPVSTKVRLLVANSMTIGQVSKKNSWRHS